MSKTEETISIKFADKQFVRSRKRQRTYTLSGRSSSGNTNTNNANTNTNTNTNSYSTNTNNANTNYNSNNNNSNNMQWYNNNINYNNANDDQYQSYNQNPSYSDIIDDQSSNGFVTFYSEALVLSMVLWFIYLLLPRGFRQFTCNAHPKRYARSRPDREIRILGLEKNTKRNSPRSVMRKHLLRGRHHSHYREGGSSVGGSSASDYSATSRSAGGSYSNGNSFRKPTRFDHRVDSGIESGRRNLQPVSNSDSSDPWDMHNNTFENIAIDRNASAVISPFQNTAEEETIDFLTPGLHTAANGNSNRLFPPTPPSLVELESLASFSNASPSPDKGIMQDPSPVHPNTHTNHRVPSHMVLSSTLTSLREPGVRLHAHGTQCEPRRIWIQLDVHKELLEWRTEQTASKNDLNASYTMGPKHTIPLKDVLYVDVGKTTSALQLLPEDVVRGDMCFSILTKNGSLDLNAGNKLERDALISCMCLILDTVYADGTDGKNWRDLHISEGSVTSRSTGTTLERPHSRGATSSGYHGGASSAGYYSYRSGSDTRTGSDVVAGIDTISENPSESNQF